MVEPENESSKHNQVPATEVQNNVASPEKKKKSKKNKNQGAGATDN